MLGFVKFFITAHQQQVRLAAGAEPRRRRGRGSRGAAAKMVHTVRTRQCMRKGQLQQLRGARTGRLAKQQRVAGRRPRQRRDAALQRQSAASEDTICREVQPALCPSAGWLQRTCTARAAVSDRK